MIALSDISLIRQEKHKNYKKMKQKLKKLRYKIMLLKKVAASSCG